MATKRKARKPAASAVTAAPLPDATPLVPIVEPRRVQVMTPAERHRRRLAAAAKPAPTDAHVSELLARMHNGEIPTEICDDAHMPQIGKLRRLISADGATVKAYEAAQSALADTLLEEAKEFLRACTETGDIEQVRIAEMYSKSMSNLAAQLAPKSHGQLVKVAGVADMPLTVNVMSFSNPDATK